MMVGRLPPALALTAALISWPAVKFEIPDSVCWGKVCIVVGVVCRRVGCCADTCTMATKTSNAELMHQEHRGDMTASEQVHMLRVSRATRLMYASGSQEKYRSPSLVKLMLEGRLPYSICKKCNRYESTLQTTDAYSFGGMKWQPPAFRGHGSRSLSKDVIDSEYNRVRVARTWICSFSLSW